MFADIHILYRSNIISLYSLEYNDDDYLFNTETIINWANEYNIDLVHPKQIIIYKDIPLQFNYN